MSGLRSLTLDRLAGRGGHGVVWKVQTAGHRVPLALKTLAPDRATDAGRRALLENEFQALARLRHPSIVRLLDAGVVQPADARPEVGLVPGTPWMLTEWIDGRSLQNAPPFRRWGPLRSLLEDLLSALAHVHARGLVHRDLTPTNVLWSWRDRRHKIIDLGLAQLAGTTAVRRVGTPGFVAPEVEALQRVDGRADLYSLGRLVAFMTRSAGLSGCPLDQLARWWQALAAADPSARPLDAAEARVALDAWLPPSPERLGPRVPAPTIEPVAPVARTTTTSLPDPVAFRTEIHLTAAVRRSFPAPLRPSTPPANPPVLELVSQLPGPALLAFRETPLVGRQKALQALWDLLGEAESGPRLVVVEAAPGLGASALLRAFGTGLRELGVAEVLGHAAAEPETGRLPVWVLDAPDEDEVAWAQARRTPGLVVLGAGTPGLPQTVPRVSLAPIPPSLWGTLVRAVLPLSPSAAGWVSLRAEGSPKAVVSTIQKALEADWLTTTPGGRVQLSAEAPPPLPPDTPTAALVDRAAALAAKEANEAAWCVLEEILDRADWGDDSDDAIRVPQLAVDLADRLPQVILPTNLPPVPLPPTGHDGWWTAAAARGVRARRRHDLDQALAFFLELQAAAKTPAQVARAAFERGATHLGQGHLVLAEECFRQALAATADGDLLGDEALASRAGHARVALCLVRCQRGAFSEALSHAAEARRIFSRLDLPGPLANLPALESPCHLWLGDLDSAEATARQSLEAYARRGSPARLVPLMNLAAVAHHRGQHALLEDILDEVGRRAVVEEPRLLVVVGLYAVLLQALRKGDRAAAALHWEEHEAAWSARPEWHPALGRMLWDLVQATTAAGWHRLARAAAARLDEVRTHHGSDCLAAFGVPVSEPATAQ